MTRNNWNLDSKNRNGSNPDVFSDVSEIKEETQAWVENLRQTTIDSWLSTASTRSDLTIEQTGLKYERNIRSLNWFLFAIEKLLKEIEDTKKWLSKKWLSKEWKKKMNNAKFTLNQYEKQLKTKKKALLNKKWEPTIYEEDINNLQKIKWTIDELKKNIYTKWQWNEPWNPELPYNSIKTSKKSNKRQANNLKYNQQYQKELERWAILRIFNWSTQKANYFLRKISQWEYSAAEYLVFKNNEAILIPYCQRRGIAIPTNPRWWRSTWWSIERGQSTPGTSTDYKNMDRWETFQQWWIVWLFEKWLSLCKNMTPWERNTWKSLAVLWGYAAWIYWLYKFFTNKKMWFWGKALTTWWVIFASQALTWENPITLFKRLLTWWFTKEYLEDKFWSLFWDAVSWVWNSWIESSNTITPAMYSLMIFQPSTTAWDIRKMTSRFKNDKENNEWKIFRKWATDKLKNKYGKNSAEYFSATFSDNFDEQKRTSRLASFWVTDSTADNTKIYELANNASTNEIILEKFKEENGLKVKSNKKNELNDYMNNLKMNNQALNIETLNNHKDWFDIDFEATYTAREVDITFKNTMGTQIDSLWIDDTKKSDLKKAMKKFYDERTIETKPKLDNFSLSVENWLLILTSHSWQKTEMDINQWELVGFWHNFSDLSELLSVAYLSNKILNSQKWKNPKDLPPFQYKRERKWICFNNATSILQDIITRENSWMDTRVLSTWRWWATNKIENLSDYPEDYADYLSKRWEKENKINIDSTLYPNVKALSDTWINFFNEQEVKDLEDWLKSIKEWQKFSEWTPNWNPYRISRKFTSRSDKLIFTAVNWDDTVFQEDLSSKFPTIMQKDNQEKFEKFMNNKKNGMRWSAIN